MPGPDQAPPFPPFWPPQGTRSMAAAKPREAITRVPKPTDINADNHPEQRKHAAATEVIDLRDTCRHRDILDGNTVIRLRAPDQDTTGIQLKIQQTGAFSVIFDALGGAELVWESGTPPDLTLTEPGKVCLLEFDFDGTTLLGSVLAQNLLLA